jgi:hypothetical protein
MGASHLIFRAHAVAPLTVAAHETDQYKLPLGREFADLGAHFSRVCITSYFAKRVCQRMSRSD